MAMAPTNLSSDYVVFRDQQTVTEVSAWLILTAHMAYSNSGLMSSVCLSTDIIQSV